MSKIYSYSFIICLLAISLIVSCKKDDNTPADQPPPTLPGTPPVVPQVENVSASVSGRVLDDQNRPLKDATVTAGTASTKTDANGAFTFTNITLNKNAGFVKVEKSGFFTGSRTFIVTTGSNNVVIQLIKKVTAGTFVAASGGTVTVSNGGSILFQAGSIINLADKSTYSGTVTVSASTINPDSINWRNIMPGALRGVDTGYNEVGLQSFGMMAVELTGGSGEKLQLKDGKPATITIPIPNSLQSEAAATIPLWYFNDTTGIWKQQGSAAKQGNNFVGQVSHFSFWNVDAPYQIVDFKLAVTGSNDQPVINAQVVISGSANGTSTWGDGVADLTGKITGKLPANKTLQLSIYSACGDLLIKKTIGPFNAATDLGVVNIPTYNAAPIMLKGTVLNCAGNLAADGEVNILLDNNYYRTTIKDGNFSILVPRCKVTSGAAKLTVLDYGTAQLSAEITKTVNDTVYDFGVISTCGTAYQRYFIVKFRGKTYTFFYPELKFKIQQQNWLQVDVINYNLNYNTTFRWWNPSFSSTPLPAVADAFLFGISTPDYESYTGLYFKMHVTEYGPEAQSPYQRYMSGYFTAMVSSITSSDTTHYPAEVSFRVRSEVYPDDIR